MDWLNYNHLFYFWTVAREGSIAQASAVLGLAQPTISVQIRKLEEAIGQKLFSRRGRGLVLSDAGRVVMSYADEIFALGRELSNALERGGSARVERFTVGVVDAVPKVVAREVLKPVMHMDPPIRLIVREGKLESLVTDLAVHRLDMVLADTQYATPSAIRTYNHRLGDTGVTFFAQRSLAGELRDGFPTSLDGAPALLPAEHSPLRNSLDAWFQSVGVRPRPVAEFEDTALLKEFGSETEAVFAVPTIAAEAVARKYDVAVVGSVPECREVFFAISAERKIKHPALVEMTRASRDSIFRD
jgi:LysR family transcriptional activator of nhaA